jgi:two-component system OmpR family response regulator
VTLRILVVEDDERLASSLHRGLEEAGMAVDTAGDGDEAVDMAATANYDVIVLDVMLPLRDGFAVARSLRDRRVSSPILMLTGRGAVEDRVHGLEVGADDYLVKPFALRELIARIKALSRRHLPDRASLLAAGQIGLDTTAHRVTVAGRQVELTAKEFAILEFFMLHRGQLLSREQILENVWDWDLEDGRNLVEVYIGRLRRKLAEAGAGDPFVTIRGAGYRFEPAG